MSTTDTIARTMSPRGDFPDTGALVISLDFEILWGMKDLLPSDGGHYRDNLLGERHAIPMMLNLFEEFETAATWATVGMLFARDREELERYFPQVMPTYDEPALSPYQYPVGKDEEDDPLHYAPTLIELIRNTPRQELATHTFSHYYCLEPGQTPEAFRADLESATAIAAANGVTFDSIVFPRNQHNPTLDPILKESGLISYRGNRTYAADRGLPASAYFHPIRRAGRIIDTYLPIDRANSTPWSHIPKPDGLANVPSNRFMGPRLSTFEPLRLRRVINEITAAAKSGTIYHIWWHPHDFGINREANIAFLRAVLEHAARCQAKYGLQSLTMADVARTALASATGDKVAALRSVR